MRAVNGLLKGSSSRNLTENPGLLLTLFALLISASNFILFLPFQFSQSALMHLASVILGLLTFAIYPRIAQRPLPARLLLGVMFLAFYGLWTYQLYLSDTINLVLLSGLMMLSIWYGLQGMYQLILGVVALLAMLIALALAGRLPMSSLVAYGLLLLLANALALLSRTPAAVQTSTGARSGSGVEYLPDSVVVEPEARVEPVLNLDADIASAEIAEEQAPDWERVLRELQSELRNTADTDALLKKMLVFVSGTVDIEAAAVGMIQDRSLNRVTQYGAEEMVGSRELAWNNERIRSLIQTQQAMVNQQDFINQAGKKVKLYRIDVPVISNSKTVGIVTMLRTSVLFNKHEVALASSIVFHAMIALRQARLQDEVKRLSTSTVNKTLFTREQFIEKAKAELAGLDKPRVFSLLIIEVDNFDEVQDKQGREAASRLSKSVAGALMGVLRNDDVLGSYGKEGFIILLHEADLLEAKKLAEDMRVRVSQLKAKQGDSVRTTTISIGLTTASEKGEDMASLIRKADMGLFVAKENGRNTVKVSL